MLYNLKNGGKLMIKRIITAVILVAGLLMTIAWAAPQQPKNWEYKFVNYNCNEKISNELAGQGWELTSSGVISYSNTVSVMCVFKRQK